MTGSTRASPSVDPYGFLWDAGVRCVRLDGRIFDAAVGVRRPAGARAPGCCRGRVAGSR